MRRIGCDNADWCSGRADCHTVEVEHLFLSSVLISNWIAAYSSYELLSCLISGFLDPSSESEDIAVGTAIELPYWLAQSLCSRRRNIVAVEIPKIYKEAYRSVVQHDSV
jgi:hypothetical protein